MFMAVLRVLARYGADCLLLIGFISSDLPSTENVRAHIRFHLNHYIGRRVLQRGQIYRRIAP